MGKKKEKEIDFEQQLIREYAHWEKLRDCGGRDPNYDDATNMNLTRNHIIRLKHHLEEKYGLDWNQYPDIYFRELPEHVKSGYVARADEIRDTARAVLEKYLDNSDFQYLLYNGELLSKKEADDVCLDYVLGYVSTLATALKEDDLLTMRRHAYGEAFYQESFSDCAEKVSAILEEKKRIPDEKEGGQMTLLQMGMEIGKCR